MKKPVRRKTKGSCPTLIGAGESAPKARLKSVVDGKQVNIPVLGKAAMWGRSRLGYRTVGYVRLVGGREV